jgi:hypothetical protein
MGMIIGWASVQVKPFETTQPPPDLLLVDEFPRPQPRAYEFQSKKRVVRSVPDGV